MVLLSTTPVAAFIFLAAPVVVIAGLVIAVFGEKAHLSSSVFFFTSFQALQILPPLLVLQLLLLLLSLLDEVEAEYI